MTAAGRGQPPGHHQQRLLLLLLTSLAQILLTLATPLPPVVHRKYDLAVYDPTPADRREQHLLTCLDRGSGNHVETVVVDDLVAAFATAGVNVESVRTLVLDLSGCDRLRAVDPHLFVDFVALRSLTIVGPRPRSSGALVSSSAVVGNVSSGGGGGGGVRIPGRLFVGLGGLQRLSVDGFESVSVPVADDLFEPLVELRRLELVRFARRNLTVDGLSRLLGHLVGRLDRLRLDSCLTASHSAAADLDVEALFARSGHLGLRRLEIVGDGVASLSGRLSLAVPTLEHIRVDMVADLYPGSIETSVDATMLHPSLRRSLVYYRVPLDDGTEASTGPDDGGCALPFALCVFIGKLAPSTAAPAAAVVGDAKIGLSSYVSAATRAYDDVMTIAKSASSLLLPESLLPSVAVGECYRGILLPLSPRYTEAIMTGSRLGWADTDSNTYCVDPSNVMEKLVYQDVHCRQSVLNWTIAGFNRLSQLVFEGGRGLQYVNPRFLLHFPNLTVLRFVDCGPGPFQTLQRRHVVDPAVGNEVDDDAGGGEPTQPEVHSLFAGNPRLRVVDFSRNQITGLPPTLFDGLERLERVNLTGNRLRRIDFRFAGVGRLTALLLADNRIETIGPSTRRALAAQSSQRLGGIGSSSGSDNEEDDVTTAAVVVDLRNNSLRCDCDALDFVDWINRTSPATVSFVDLPSYRCVLPDGRLERLIDVDVRRLRDDCAAVASVVNGSACPCDAPVVARLAAVRFHLAGVWCRAPSPTAELLLPLDALLADDAERQLAAACSGLRRRLLPLRLAAAASSVCLVGIGVMAVVAYRRRWIVWRHSDIRSIVRDYFRLVWKYARGAGLLDGNDVEDYDGDSGGGGRFDVFLVHHETDRKFATDVVRRGLVGRLGRAVGTEDQLAAGSVRLEANVEAMARSEHVVFVVSPDFVNSNQHLHLALYACELAVNVVFVAEGTVDNIISLASRTELRYTIERLFESCPVVEWSSRSRRDSAAFWDNLRRLLTPLRPRGGRRFGCVSAAAAAARRTPAVAGREIERRRNRSGIIRSSTCPRFEQQT